MKRFIVCLLILLAGCLGGKDESRAKKRYESGESFQRVGMYELAIKEYEAVIEKYPKTRWAKSAKEQIAECKRCLAVKNEFSEIMRLKDAKRYSEAKDRFLEFVKKYPDTYFEDEAIYQIGICYEEEGDFEKAIQYLEKATATNPSALLELERLKRDEENYKKGLSLMEEEKYYEARIAFSSVKKMYKKEAEEKIAEIKDILKDVDVLYRPVLAEEEGVEEGTTSSLQHGTIPSKREKISLVSAKGLNTPFLLLDWTEAEGLIDAVYTLEIARDSEFVDKVFIKRTRETSMRIEEPFDKGIYYWRVKAKAGSALCESNVGFFEIGGLENEVYY
jgi:tetratricopeptide (TPR) repeat protein